MWFVFPTLVSLGVSMHAGSQTAKNKMLLAIAAYVATEVYAHSKLRPMYRVSQISIISSGSALIGLTCFRLLCYIYVVFLLRQEVGPIQVTHAWGFT